MRIGIVCPYSWDVAGGVQFHIRDLATELIARGHEVSVLAPAENAAALPEFIVPTGAAIPIRYNGSVARLAFGPRVAREVRAWLKAGNFDVLHVHEPFLPSLSIIAVVNAACPVVSTHHAAMDRSRAMDFASPMVRGVLERISARIAVSQEARRTAVQYLGGDAYVIPNGVYTESFAQAQIDARFAGTADAPALGFLGRIDEPRKGLPVVARAFPAIVEAYPNVRLFVAGVGNHEAARARFGRHADHVEFLGPVSEEDKAAMLASVDLYLAPNTGGESFGIILIEAMSAGAFVVASDIPAFQAVLGTGRYGAQFANDDADELAATVIESLARPERRAETCAAARLEARRYDWSAVASQVLAVYETAVRTASLEVESR